MSQGKVAKRLAVAQSRIAKLELWTRRLLYVEALDLAEIYGVDVSSFDPRSYSQAKPAPGPRAGRQTAAADASPEPSSRP
jgi:hypothetical protein